MAANTDKFLKGARKLAGTIDASGIIDGVIDNFGLSSASGIPTGTAVEITVDRVSPDGKTKTPANEETICGVVDGDRIINAVRGVEGTAKAHAAGAVWEIRLTASQWNKMIDGLLAEHNQDGRHNFSKISPPRGYLINGKITVVDAAGITVAIKTLAGNDPSVTDPVYVRIGDTVRAITSALSRSLADGTNWFNAGSAELATKEIDYFAYLVWDSNSSAVALSFARIPYANLVSDFSATTTNEKHCAGYSGFTTTDEVENIGRFAATLSAGAGYTWSVPTFTAINLIQRPIFETRILIATAVLTGFSGTPTQTIYYQLRGNVMLIHVTISGTSNATNFLITMPFISTTVINEYKYIVDNTTLAIVGLAQITNGTRVITLYKDGGGTVFTASGTKRIDAAVFNVFI